MAERRLAAAAGTADRASLQREEDIMIESRDLLPQLELEVVVGGCGWW